MDLDAQLKVVVAYLADPRNPTAAAAFHALADDLAGAQRPRPGDGQGDDVDDVDRKSPKKTRR